MATATSDLSGESSQESESRLILPDGTGAKGSYGPFTTDPGWREVWWWFGVPALLCVFLIGVHTTAPGFYREWIIPEGHGFLELGHFFIPLAGLVIALGLMARPYVRQRRYILALTVLAALACLYIAGEEMSWGQHFFNWQTPDFWAKLNRQQETNLHNITDAFDKKPRLVLEIGVFVGGLLVPLASLFSPRIRRNRWSLFMPADAMVPVALGVVLFKAFHFIENSFGFPMPVFRPSEATETFLYLFILFYLIVFARRIGELERDAPGSTG